MAGSITHDIDAAVDAIIAGGLAAMPTETVYGLAADAANDHAVARIFAAKGRPQFNPLIIHVRDAEMAQRYAQWPALADRLATDFWPGPLTLVLPRAEPCAISALASAGLSTLALRAPAHDIAQRLIEKAGRALAAPSANPSGALSPTRAAHVQAGLGDKVDIILDGGAPSIGIESTIVKIEGDEAILLRPGGLAREEIELALGAPLIIPASPGGKTPVEAPGMTASHYAPRAPLRLNVETPLADEAYLAFGPTRRQGETTLNLSPQSDPTEAAANLFAYLHRLDALCVEKALIGIAAAPIPAKGLGEAIRDRLNRAAAPRR